MVGGNFNLFCFYLLNYFIRNSNNKIMNPAPVGTWRRRV